MLPLALMCAVCGREEQNLMRCGQCLSRINSGSECQNKDFKYHAAQCKRQNIILKVDLFPKFITKPPITRTISCPAVSNFTELHNAIQVAFGWSNKHHYAFDVFGPRESKASQSRLANPDFRIGDLNWMDEDSESEDEDWDYACFATAKDGNQTSLFEVFDDPNTQTKNVLYEDHKRGMSYGTRGDGWKHNIKLVGRADFTSY
ncbi:hypothetical protein WAI453_008978 [Rhynchosporium graminicola]